MTNRERLISFLGFLPSDDSVDGALIDAGIDGSGTYVLLNSTPLKTTAVSILQLLLTTADTIQDNGGSTFTVKYDRKAVMDRIGLLNGELGLSEGVATITAKKKW